MSKYNVKDLISRGIKKTPKFKRPKIKFALSIKTILFSILAVVILVIIGFGVAIYGFKADNSVTKRMADIIPYPISTVNWSPITLSEFNFTVDYTHHFYQASKLTFDQKSVETQVLDQLIDQKIIEQHAKSSKVQITSADVDKAYQQLIDKSGKDEVNKVLNDLYGLTEKQFKQLIYEQLLKQKLEKQMRDNNQWHQIEIRHILIKVDKNADQKTVDDAKNRALDNLNQIKAGKSFDEMARKNSEDVESKDQGGELGYVSRGQLVKQLEDAIFASGVKKGDLIGPVRSMYGWHIIQIEDIRGTNDYQIWRQESKIFKLIKI